MEQGLIAWYGTRKLYMPKTENLMPKRSRLRLETQAHGPFKEKVVYQQSKDSLSTEISDMFVPVKAGRLLI